MTEQELNGYLHSLSVPEILSVGAIAAQVKMDVFGTQMSESHPVFTTEDALEVWHTAILVWEHRQLWAIQ